jgi:aminopeptidase-like protein
MNCLGKQMHAFAADLYPICRSITGNGVRETLARIGERIPLSIRETPSGTEVFDWTIPREWNVRDAYIADAHGTRVVDFRSNNLHLLNYSAPVRTRLSRAELAGHIFTLPEQPDAIPYRTSYYKEQWGFCLSENQWQSLPDGEYDVFVDTTLENGSLTYAECLIPGTSNEEILFSTHICHPSLCNDNLSGIAVATFLASALMADRSERRYSYRFLFVPGTIGSITWLSHNRDRAHLIKHGLVLTCIGDAGGFNYKRSRQGDAVIDRVVAQVLAHSGEPHQLRDFSPYGYDERQYCSPGFNLPVGLLMRSAHGEFPEYHTSNDNLDFLRLDSLERSLDVCKKIAAALEGNVCYESKNAFCEAQLGKRGLYQATGGAGIGTGNMALLWLMNLADRRHSLLDVAERSGLPLDCLHHAAQQLEASGLVERVAAK